MPTGSNDQIVQAARTARRKQVNEAAKKTARAIRQKIAKAGANLKADALTQLEQEIAGLIEVEFGGQI